MPIRYTCMCRQGTGIIYCFLSRCCNSTYGKAIGYNTKDLTSFLALLPTILAPALLQQAGVGEHRICVQGVKTVCPPFYTNSGPGNWPIETIRMSIRLCYCIGLISHARRPVITADYCCFMQIRGYSG